MPVSSETKAVAVLMSRICHRFQEVPSSGLLLWSLPLAPPLFTLPGEVSAKHSALQIPYIGKESLPPPPPFEFGRYSHQSAFVHANKTSHHSVMWQSVSQMPQLWWKSWYLGWGIRPSEQCLAQHWHSPGCLQQSQHRQRHKLGTSSLMKWTNKKLRALHTEHHTVLKSSRSVLHTEHHTVLRSSWSVLHTFISS